AATPSYPSRAPLYGAPSGVSAVLHSTRQQPGSLPPMRRLVATVAVAGVAVSGAGARQDPSQPRTIFRSSVDLVHLDVSVLDANRRPVRGLGPADFIVLEDGKPQRIAVFNAVDIPDPEPDPEAAAWTRT